MWKRKAQVVTGGREINFPDLHMEFRIEFDEDEDANVAEIEIFNLTEDTINRIKRGNDITLNAGYKDDVGNIFLGKIDEVHTVRDGTERITQIETTDTTEEWMKSRISKTYKDGIRASQILRDILDKSGLEIGRLDLPEDVIYRSGKVVDNTIKDAVRGIITDAGAKLYINAGTIYVSQQDYGRDVGVVLNKDTGLIGSPTRIEDEEGAEWEVRCLLNHRIGPGAYVIVESKNANGTYRVIRGEHDGTDYVTTVEVGG